MYKFHKEKLKTKKSEKTKKTERKYDKILDVMHKSDKKIMLNMEKNQIRIEKTKKRL